jgi:hypothetical protein
MSLRRWISVCEADIDPSIDDERLRFLNRMYGKRSDGLDELERLRLVAQIDKTLHQTRRDAERAAAELERLSLDNEIKRDRLNDED